MESNYIYYFHFKKLIFIIFIFQLLLLIIFIKIYKSKIMLEKQLYKEFKISFYDFNFIIIKNKYSNIGLFGLYISYLGCIIKYINEGFIPIIDLSSFPNIFNGFNIKKSDENPWELFFNQPFNYKLKNIKKYAKKVKYINCISNNRPDTTIYYKKSLLNFWHYLAEKYIPINEEIINESNIIRNNIFNGSSNVLGILIRGTDYISRKPRGHPIQPSPDLVINDTKIMDKKNKYDLIFITKEDDLIREKFKLKIGQKLKFIKSNKNVKYNYKNKELLAYNKNIIGNIKYMKIYLINIIILSKCIDIICSRTAGSVGTFIISKGFRNMKVYYLGRYK